MSVYTQDSPGPWNVWIKRKENKNLPILEAKRKFLKEQLLFEQQFANFVAQQQAIQSDSNTNAGNEVLNKVETIDFVSSPVFLSQTANSQSITAQFTFPVSVDTSGGDPTITVNNSQAGGGSAATFTYTYFSGSETNLLEFRHNHPAFASNNGGAAANVLPIQLAAGPGVTSRGAIINSPTAPVNDTYVNAAYTTGTGNGSSAQFTVVVEGGDITTINAVVAGTDFVEGDVVTFADDALGTGSTGGGFTITSNNLTGDVISIPAQSIALNGGAISTYSSGFNTQVNDAIRRQGANPPLSMPGGSLTRTVIAG